MTKTKKQKTFKSLKSSEANLPSFSSVSRGSQVLIKSKRLKAKKVPDNFLDHMQDYIDFHDNTVLQSDSIKAGDAKKAWVDFVVNTSGGILLIPDMRDTDNPEAECLSMEPGDGVSLTALYDIKLINRSRKGLLTAMQTPSIVYSGLPHLLAVESREKLESLPFNFIAPSSLAEELRKKGKGTIYVDVPNIFDKKMAQLNKVERDEASELRREASNEAYNLEELEHIIDPDEGK